MKSYKTFLVYAISGAFLGQIFTTVYLAWLFSPHGINSLLQSLQFLAIGASWGLVCGIGVAMTPGLFHGGPRQRAVQGALLGSLSGFMFYAISYYATYPTDTLITILARSFAGLLTGLISGVLVAQTAGIINKPVQRIWKYVLTHYQNDPMSRLKIPANLLIGSSSGFLIGSIINWCATITIIVSQYQNDSLVFSLPVECTWFYALTFGLVVIIPLITFFNPPRIEYTGQIFEGIRAGFVFSILALLFLLILYVLIQLPSLPKPAIFATPDLDPLRLSRFYIILVTIFTVFCGYFEGLFAAGIKYGWAAWRHPKAAAAVLEPPAPKQG